VWSERLGLIGRCDLVEFAADGTPCPVEYKHGRRRRWANDDLQLCGQALCLEEMLGRPVARGAVFHRQSNRRRVVVFDAGLQTETVRTAAAVRSLLAAGNLPPPVFGPRCEECSMQPVCLPQINGQSGGTFEQLFVPLPEPTSD
jgi:CRISPR-associated exonuclease Cas4